jgi:hypothetical protein
MLFTIIAALACATSSLTIVPEEYRTVYISSKQDTKFVIAPKTRASGSTLVVYVKRIIPTECMTL